MLEMRRRRKIFTLLKVTDCYFELTNFRKLTACPMLVTANSATEGFPVPGPSPAILHPGLSVTLYRDGELSSWR